MGDIEVLSRTQRIVVEERIARIVLDQTRHIKIYNSGTFGPQGFAGPTGPTGPQGPVGTHRFYGEGPPGTIIGSQPNDEYLDVLSGDLYTLL